MPRAAKTIPKGLNFRPFWQPRSHKVPSQPGTPKNTKQGAPKTATCPKLAPKRVQGFKLVPSFVHLFPPLGPDWAPDFPRDPPGGGFPQCLSFCYNFCRDFCHLRPHPPPPRTEPSSTNTTQASQTSMRAFLPVSLLLCGYSKCSHRTKKHGGGTSAQRT